MVDERPLLPTLDSDPAMALHLRKSLRTLAAAAPDPEFKKLIGQVLDGRANLRDVVDSTAFSKVLDPLVSTAVTELSKLSDEERETLAMQGRQQVDEEYAAAVERAKRDQARDDDDDEYFDNPPPILSRDW